MERTFFTKDVVAEYALQVSISKLPDEISRHINTFLPCKDIMKSIHCKKMARFVAGRSDAWILSHIPMFEKIHRRNFTEMIQFFLKQGGRSADIAWFQDNMCTFKKGRKYFTSTRANGNSNRMLLADAVKFLRKTAYDDYTYRKVSPSMVALHCVV
jgi:hypothetical protein